MCLFWKSEFIEPLDSAAYHLINENLTFICKKHCILLITQTSLLFYNNLVQKLLEYRVGSLIRLLAGVQDNICSLQKVMILGDLGGLVG